MTLQLDFATTLVDEWVRCGVLHAVIAPGSRSSPLAIALLSEQRLAVHVRLDERSAAFFALGTALESGRPAVLVTTSGTAAAEVHSCVLEADLARVPLIVCTADRPPELHRVGAPQTVEQVGLFSGALRYFADPGVPDVEGRPHWRSLAARAFAEASAGPTGPGPVHLNLAFREPLVGPLGEVPPPAPGGGAWHEVVRAPSVSPEALACFVELCAGASRGVVLAGGGAAPAGGQAGMFALAEACGWPVLADVRAVTRAPHPVLVTHGDGIVRTDAARATLTPDLVVHLGSPHASKVLATWTAELGAAGVPSLLVDPFGAFEDPDRHVTTVIGADPALLCTLAAGELAKRRHERSPGWLEAWRTADDAAEAAIEEHIGAAVSLSEAGVAWHVVSAATPGAVIVASSSMPVRDLEWYAPARPGAPRILSNRGANGIDGVTSTVLGVAASARRADPDSHVIGLLGDLAFFHDLSGLVWGAQERVPDATLVVVDNHGGGIFSFLSYGELDEAVFERAFGTPQSPDIAEVAAALGCHVDAVDDPASFDKALDAAGTRAGISVILVSSDRAVNVAAHGELNSAISVAVAAALGAR